MDGDGTRSPGNAPRQADLRRAARRLVSLAAFVVVAACTGTSEPTTAHTALLVDTTAVKRASLPSAPEVVSPQPVASIAPAPVIAPVNLAEIDPAPLRPATDWRGDTSENGPFRDQGARARRGAIVKQLFADAGVKYPASEVYFRVFKKEGKLEVWANDAKGTPLKPIATYGICYASGDVGPKRHEGDLQVPEGFYKVPYIWTDTNYHLALSVSYPNPFDRAQSPKSPGGAILIHGSCVSIGCISMSDERIEELWTIVQPLYRRGELVELHIFPSRDMESLMADPEYEKHVAFWKLIRPTLDQFNADHLLPAVSFNSKSQYTVNGKPVGDG